MELVGTYGNTCRPTLKTSTSPRKHSNLASLKYSGPKIVCFLTQSVQLTLVSVQLTWLKYVVWNRKMSARLLMQMISCLRKFSRQSVLP